MKIVVLGFSIVCKGAWLLLRSGLDDTMLIHEEDLYRDGYSAADLLILGNNDNTRKKKEYDRNITENYFLTLVT